MITKITDKKSDGWIFYDADCGVCSRLAKRFAPLLHGRRFELVPLQAPDSRERLGMKPDEPFDEMKLLTADGKVIGGADSMIFLAKKIWWAWPFYILAQIPGIKFLMRKGYRWFAKNRHRFGNACESKKSQVHRTIPFFEMP